MSEFLDESELADLYQEGQEEPETRVEDQDLRVLKAIVSDQEIARSWASSSDSKVFIGDAVPFAEHALKCYRKYDALPTRRIMLERVGKSELAETFSDIWDQLERIEYNRNEYNYDLEKIKQRFSYQKISSIKRTVQQDGDLEEALEKIRADLEETERVRRGNAKAFVQRTAKDYLDEFKHNYIAKTKDPEKGQGILTHYSYLDYVTNGLEPSSMLLIGGETGAGKAIEENTLVPTPSGFRKHGDLKVGDKIFGSDGKVYNVLAESKIYNDPGWKFIFNDGSEVISHDNHEWLTFDRKEQAALSKRTPEFRAKRKAKRKSRAVKNTKSWLTEANKNRKYELLPPPKGTIRTSKEIAETLFVHKNKRRNYAIPIAEPVELPEKELLIDPYLFGCWLGDGTAKDGVITTMDEDIVQEIISSQYKLGAVCTQTNKNEKLCKTSTYRLLGLRSDLKKLGVFGNKHIPHDYLWASKEQRLALLQGLMDTDGYVSEEGNIDFVNTNKNIAEGVAHLVRSLGEKCTITQGEAKLGGRVTGPKWTVRFSSSFPVFRLKRKLERQNLEPRLNKFRYIVDAVRVPAVPMKCIQVDSPDHLYLCTENFIPTHNSMLLLNMAVQMWRQRNSLDFQDPSKGYNIQYFSLEMPFDQCFLRLFASLGELPTYGLRDAKITHPQLLEKMGKAAKFIERFQPEFEIVDIPRGVTVQDIEERYLEAKAQDRAPDVVVVDYLGLMQDPKAEGDDWLRLGQIAGQLHEFARVYNVVVLSAVQLNRPKNRDPEEAIGLHRIGRSSLIMHHATVGVQIETRKNEAAMQDMKYHIIKNRNGELGSHLLKKSFRTATLRDLEIYQPRHNDLSFDPVQPGLEDMTEALTKCGFL